MNRSVNLANSRSETSKIIPRISNARNSDGLMASTLPKLSKVFVGGTQLGPGDALLLEFVDEFGTGRAFGGVVPGVYED